jgi:hypothetical protein
MLVTSGGERVGSMSGGCLKVEVSRKIVCQINGCVG